MPQVILRNTRENRPVILTVDADYDNGAFISVVLTDGDSGDDLLDLTSDDAVAIYDAVYETLKKFLSLRG